MPPAESRSATVTAGAPDRDRPHPGQHRPAVPLQHEAGDAVPAERDHERDDRHAVGRKAGAEEQRRDRRLQPALAVTQRADAEDEAAHRHHPADVLGRVHVQVAAQLVVQDREGEERQERREHPQPQLAAERPEPRPEPGRCDPQERPHRRKRRAPEDVRRAGVEAVQDELRDRGRVERAPLERLPRHLAGVGQLQAVGPVPPRPEHLEVEERRAPQADDRDREQDDEPRGDREAVLRELLAQRLEMLARAAPAQRRAPERQRDREQGREERRLREHVRDHERGGRQPDGDVSERKGERDPGREAGAAGREDRQHRARPRHQDERRGGAERGRAHSSTTQSRPAISQTVGSSKNEL